MTLRLAPRDRPFLPRGVRISEDRVRGGKVLLGPERAVALDAIGEAILSRVDGQACFAEIIEDLAADYDATPDQISGDVQHFLAGLRVRMFLAVAR